LGIPDSSSRGEVATVDPGEHSLVDLVSKGTSDNHACPV
jgi:hypothetical protein